MDKIFPEFIRFFFAALLLLVSASLVNSSANKKPVDIPFSFGISKDLSLLIYLIISLYALKVLFSSVRNLIVKYNDSRQINYSRSDLDSPSLFGKQTSAITTDGTFLYEVQRLTDPTYRAKNIGGLSDISNPKCSKDKCLTELVVQKSYFGRYIYRCPLCKNTVRSIYSVSTHQEHVRLIERKEILIDSIQKAETKKIADEEKAKQDYQDFISLLDDIDAKEDRKTQGFYDDPFAPDLPQNERELNDFENGTK